MGSAWPHGALAEDRRVPVPAGLEELLPGGLRQGSTVGVSAPDGWGATTLALGLVAGATSAHRWTAVVGLPSLGARTATEVGVCLDRMVTVPHPGRHWPVVTAALLEELAVVVVVPPGRVHPGDARRLQARARERGAVLVVRTTTPTSSGAGSRVDGWQGMDLSLRVVDTRWLGLQAGWGHLRCRQATVAVGGKGAASRERRVRLWLPGPDGSVAAVPGELLRPTEPVRSLPVAGDVPQAV